MNEEKKSLAIALRKEGKTYREILEQVPVAKSTLTEWFKKVDLAFLQVQRITQAKIDGRLRGAASRHVARVAEVNSLIEKGKEEVGIISDRELWLIGIALYWGEGSKQRESSPSTGIVFNNTDPGMLKLFIKWLDLLEIPEDDRRFEIYLHDTRKEELESFKSWWAEKLNIPISKLSTVYFKKTQITTNRKNTADLYHGLIRIKVRTSTVLNRQVNGWIEGIVQQ